MKYPMRSSNTGTIYIQIGAFDSLKNFSMLKSVTPIVHHFL